MTFVGIVADTVFTDRHPLLVDRPVGTTLLDGLAEVSYTSDTEFVGVEGVTRLKVGDCVRVTGPPFRFDTIPPQVVGRRIERLDPGAPECARPA